MEGGEGGMALMIRGGFFFEKVGVECGWSGGKRIFMSEGFLS